MIRLACARDMSLVNDMHQEHASVTRGNLPAMTHQVEPNTGSGNCQRTVKDLRRKQRNMKDSGAPSTSQASSSETPAHKCCLGMLYYSQAIHDRGKNPVCAGVRSKHLTSSELAEMPPESIPTGEFKYMCLGYSMHADRRKQKQSQLPTKDQDSIELPYCEGIQVVVATEPQHSPMLQSDASQAGAAQQTQPDRRPPRKTYGGSQADNNLGGVELGELSDRFLKTSGKILNKMGSNANQLVSTAKEVADKLGEQIWGKKD